MGPQAPAPPPPPGFQQPPPPPGTPPAPVWQQPPRAAFAGGQLAGWGSRVGAALLDGLILVIPVAILIAIIVAVAAGSDTGAIVTGIIGVIAYLVVLCIYAPVLMMRGGPRNGQTWGKQIVGIRVARDNGQPFDFGSALLREFVVKGLLFNGVGSFFFYIPGLVDVLWPLWDDQNRTLHDMVVSTHVVSA